MLRLVRPAAPYLPAYVEALKTGWSANNLAPAEAAAEELRQIGEDPEAFLISLDDPEARGPPVRLPDGTLARRLPGYRRWLWDDGFCGSISLRWLERGSAELPEHVLGHVGYAVVPQRRNSGYATRGLRLLLPDARALGLPWIEVTTTPDNIASQKVVQAVGGRLIEVFKKPAAFGGGDTLRWRIDL